jgi:hypothetical protein
MYERPKPKDQAVYLQMGSGRQAEFHPGSRRLFVGGVAHGDVRDSPSPTIDMVAVAGLIDYLDPNGTVPTKRSSYQAARVAFGGRVYRTWMLHGAKQEEHALAAVLALIDADPAVGKAVLEDQNEGL